MRKLAATVASALAIVAFGLQNPASANDYRLDLAGAQGAYPRSSPAFQDRTGAAVARGTVITSINCFVEGELVTNSYGYQSPYWFRDGEGHFWSEAWLETGSDGLPPGLMHCDDVDKPAGPGSTGYDGSAAASWAMANYEIPERFQNGDCAWFLSQALRAGGLPESAEWTTPGYLDPPAAATLADGLYNYLVDNGKGIPRPIAWSDLTASGAEIGDVIAYDWDGPADGVIDHLAIVTTLNGTGEPSVTQHTPAQLNRYWSWSETANNWVEYASEGSTATLVDMTP